MKVSLPARTFAYEVGWLARHLPSRPAIPVLGGIRVDAAEGAVRMTAFDFEVCARTELAADVHDPGGVLVSGRLLAAASAQLPDAEATLAIDGSTLTLECGVVRYGLPLLPLDDYPTLPTQPQPVGRVDGGVFADALARTAVAVSTEPVPVVLNFVRLSFTPSGLTLAASDRYRLAQHTVSWGPTLDDVDHTVLVDPHALTPTVKALRNDDIELGVDYTEGGIPTVLGLRGAQRTLTARLYDDTNGFPKIEKLLANAAAGPTVLTADIARLREAVHRAGAVAGRALPIRLTAEDGHIAIAGGSPDEGVGADTCPAEITGPPQAIAASPRLLGEALKAVPGERARITLSEAHKPILILPDHDTDNCQHIVMPVRISG